MKVTIHFNKAETAKAYLRADDYFFAMQEIYFLLHKQKNIEVIEEFEEVAAKYGIDYMNDMPEFSDDVS